MTTQLNPATPGAPPPDPRTANQLDFEHVNVSPYQQVLTAVIVAVPFAALLATVPLAWMGGWLSWHDIVLGLAFYWITNTGIGVGFHRHFTHGSFKANRGLKIALAIAGSLGLEGSLFRWTGDHRRHHRNSDREGDPHSPWRFGSSSRALFKGMIYAHIGWLFNDELTDLPRFIPDLMADRDLQKVNRAFPLIAVATFVLPAALGGLWSLSWHGVFTAFFWAVLVRIGLLHHVTWSINSICHTFGARPFRSRDKSGNVWWLAILSQGESWHNLHHADPTSARHGALPGQIDINARTIRVFELLRLATNVRWPTAKRLQAKRAVS